MRLHKSYDTRSRNPGGFPPKQDLPDASISRDSDAVNGLEKVIGFGPLYRSMTKCSNNVKWKDGVASYLLNGIERTIRLSDELHNGTYTPKPLRRFKITYPKPRDISANDFRDRVYQRSLNDNVLYPTMTKTFVRDNAACQKGKGTDYARDRLDIFLHKYYRRYGSEGWYLQIDIKGYYPNMQHSVAEKTFEDTIDEPFYSMAYDVLEHQYDGYFGYEPGSQMIQLAGISVLSKLDHYIKERLRIKYYIRYMDDLILIHQDRVYLEYCLSQISEQLAEIGFEFNERKTGIFPLSKSIRFLGFDFRLTDSGKVVKTVNPENVRVERKRLRRQVHKCRRGEITREAVEDSYNCWKAHAAKGNSYKMLGRMDKYYESLWKEPI